MPPRGQHPSWCLQNDQWLPGTGPVPMLFPWIRGGGPISHLLGPWGPFGRLSLTAPSHKVSARLSPGWTPNHFCKGQLVGVSYGQPPFVDTASVWCPVWSSRSTCNACESVKWRPWDKYMCFKETTLSQYYFFAWVIRVIRLHVKWNSLAAKQQNVGIHVVRISLGEIVVMPLRYFLPCMIWWRAVLELQDIASTCATTWSHLGICARYSIRWLRYCKHYVDVGYLTVPRHVHKLLAIDMAAVVLQPAAANLRRAASKHLRTH